MTDIKNIIFDLGGVIVDLDVSRCIDAFRQIGIPNAADYLLAHRAERLLQATEVEGISTHAFCDMIRELSGTTVPDNDIVWAWNQFLAGTTDARKSRLLELARHHRVFLLSNTNEMHWVYSAQTLLPFGSYGVADYFERVFLSYEMHLAKPQPEIFAETLRMAGLRAEETLFIDDRVENCEAAARLGIRTYRNAHPDDWVTADEVPHGND